MKLTRCLLIIITECPYFLLYWCRKILSRTVCLESIIIHNVVSQQDLWMFFDLKGYAFWKMVLQMLLVLIPLCLRERGHFQKRRVQKWQKYHYRPQENVPFCSLLLLSIGFSCAVTDSHLLSVGGSIKSVRAVTLSICIITRMWKSSLWFYTLSWLLSFLNRVIC